MEKKGTLYGECIAKGHKYRWIDSESHGSSFGLWYEFKYRCVRCGYVKKGTATKKEVLAVKLLGLL